MTETLRVTPDRFGEAQPPEHPSDERPSDIEEWLQGIRVDMHNDPPGWLDPDADTDIYAGSEARSRGQHAAPEEPDEFGAHTDATGPDSPSPIVRPRIASDDAAAPSVGRHRARD